MYGWAGDFLDVGPDRKGRGGRHCKILGKRFEVGAKGALKIGDSTPVFQGYSRLGVPEIHYSVGEATVGQTVSLHVGLVGDILKRGLLYTFMVTNANGTVTFNLNPAEVLVEASAGKWNPDKTALSLNAKEASEFTVTLLPKN